jgi:hypothetical protein
MWFQDLKHDMGRIEMRDWKQKAQERDEWRKMVEEAKAGCRASKETEKERKKEKGKQ